MSAVIIPFPQRQTRDEAVREIVHRYAVDDVGLTSGRAMLAVWRAIEWMWDGHSAHRAIQEGKRYARELWDRMT